MTDGELYWIIENGIRLTGMPAWGSGDGNDADTWKLLSGETDEPPPDAHHHD
jgi:mono/diheme cytochrome c family protein